MDGPFDGVHAVFFIDRRSQRACRGRSADGKWQTADVKLKARQGEKRKERRERGEPKEVL
jgi:hypothetical protein